MKKKLTIAGCLVALCAMAETCLNYSFQNSNTGAGIHGDALDTTDGQSVYTRAWGYDNVNSNVVWRVKTWATCSYPPGGNYVYEDKLVTNFMAVTVSPFLPKCGATTPDGRSIRQIQSQIWKVTASNVTVAGWWSDKD